MLATLLLTALAQTEPTTDADPETPTEKPAEDPVVPTEPEPTGPPIDPLLGEPYTPTRNGQVGPDNPYWDLEVLYHQEKHLEGVKLAEARYAETKDPHLTLHIGRFWHQFLEGDTVRTKKERREIYANALALMDEGLAADPNDKHLEFARGVVMARIGTTDGVLASLRLADDIETAWLNTVASNEAYGSIGLQEELPCDAYLALGIFYRLVPDSWIVKAIAGTKGDLDKSLEMLEKGAKCSGPRIRSLKELAVTQLCIGTKRKDEAMIAKGKETVNQYMMIAPIMGSEVIDIKHGPLLLTDPKTSCGYSRDGQQELDEAKLKKE